jgi:dienelactone hydrolase
MRLTVTLAAAIAAIIPLLADADTPSPSPLVPIASFARQDQYYNPVMSPDGKHLAVTVRTPVDKRTVPMVTFYSLPDLKLESIVRMPLFSVPVNYVWVSNTRLVVQKGIEVGTREKPQLTGEILTMDFDGSHQDYLFGRDMAKLSSRGSRTGADRGYAYPAYVPLARNAHLLLGTYQWDLDQSALYDVDTRTAVRKLVTTLDAPNASFVAQNDGKPRFANGSSEEGFTRAWRLSDETGKWDVMENKKDSRLSPFAFSADDRQFLAWNSELGGPLKIIRQDLATGARKIVAADTMGDIGTLMMDHTALPIAALTEIGRPRVIYLEENHPDVALEKDLSRQFPDHTVKLINESDDASKVLFSVRSDRDPGAYFIYDRKTNKADMLFAAMADIEPDDMAPRRPIHFNARDGLRIDGYLTLPVQKTAQKPPLILIPHGGPDEADTWYFDGDAQFLANRGYAVLQLNFRGSTSKGVSFKNSAHLQWGGKVINDLIDGVKWTVQQGEVDGSRMCVAGVSGFGGYAALMLASREPDLFKCAVGYAGLYDLAMMQKEDGLVGNSRKLGIYKRHFGEDPVEWARYSPTQHADTIKAGVLLIHGGKDKRAPKEHAFLMKEALEKAGHPPEWYYVDYEGHGFYDTENQAEVYKRIENFFGKYLGKPRG